MSRYTVSVHDLIANNFDFGLKEYAIFDEKYRKTLNTSILEYYRFEEIAYANPTQWKERLNFKLDLLMRNKYNKLYEARIIEFNPLYNIDITETHERNISNNSNFNSKNENENSQTDENKTLSTNSAFPTEEMLESEIIGNMYVNSAGKNSENNTTNGTDKTINEEKSESGTIENYTTKTLGSSAGLPFSKAMIQLHEFADMYDLDIQVCKDLSNYFWLYKG